MRRLIGVLAVGLMVSVAAPAFAQSSPAPTRASRLGARAFGWGDWQQMIAKDSFDAVAGTTTVRGPGGGAEVQRLWREVFVRGSVSRLRVEGERVFVFDGQVFRLGIPLEITMMPIEVAAGWRFTPLGSRKIAPYVGGGVVFLRYREEADDDGPSDRVNESYRGAVVFGGVDVPVWRFVSAGAEVAYRTVNVPDPGGTFEVFGEKNLGGVSMRVMVSIRK